MRGLVLRTTQGSCGVEQSVALRARRIGDVQPTPSVRMWTVAHCGARMPMRSSNETWLDLTLWRARPSFATVLSAHELSDKGGEKAQTRRLQILRHREKSPNNRTS